MDERWTLNVSSVFQDSGQLLYCDLKKTNPVHQVSQLSLFRRLLLLAEPLSNSFSEWGKESK